MGWSPMAAQGKAASAETQHCLRLGKTPNPSQSHCSAKSHRSDWTGEGHTVLPHNLAGNAGCAASTASPQQFASPASPHFFLVWGGPPTSFTLDKAQGPPGQKVGVSTSPSIACSCLTNDRAEGERYVSDIQ